MVMRQPRTESLVESRLLRYMKGIPGLVHFKMGRDGWPDRIVCYRGVFIGIEIKSERINHEPTVRQTQRIEQIKRVGGLAGVVRSEAELEQFLHRVDNWYHDGGGFPWSQR